MPNIEMCEWFDEHFYKYTAPDGTVDYYPSVTTKLGASPKPGLIRWYGDVGNKEAQARLRETSEKGKRIHYACYLYATDKGVVVYNPYQRPNFSEEEIKELRQEKEVLVLQDQDEMWQVAKFQAWCKEVQPEIIGAETIIYDHDYREAGTIDLVMNINAGKYNISGSKAIALEPGIYIADIKTGSVWDEAYMQISAYGKMWEKVNKKPVAGGLIINTGNSKIKSGIPGLKTHLKTREEMEYEYESYRHISAIWERTSARKPRIFEFPKIIRRDKNES